MHPAALLIAHVACLAIFAIGTRVLLAAQPATPAIGVAPQISAP